MVEKSVKTKVRSYITVSFCSLRGVKFVSLTLTFNKEVFGPIVLHDNM